MQSTKAAESIESTVSLTINGKPVTVSPGTTVAAAMLMTDAAARISVRGEPRNPLCAIGICMECCATIDGTPHVRTCLVTAKPGMQVTTG